MPPVVFIFRPPSTMKLESANAKVSEDAFNAGSFLTRRSDIN